MFLRTNIHPFLARRPRAIERRYATERAPPISRNRGIAFTLAETFQFARTSVNRAPVSLDGDGRRRISRLRPDHVESHAMKTRNGYSISKKRKKENMHNIRERVGQLTLSFSFIYNIFLARDLVESSPHERNRTATIKHCRNFDCTHVENRTRAATS